MAATDRGAVFVGVEAYTEASGTILRDLFTEDRGGYFEDVALLDLLVTGKPGRTADALRDTEGWKWTQAHLDFPHAHGLRRTYPQPVELSAQDQAALDAVQAEFNSLTEQHDKAEERPEEVDARFGELETEIERLEAKRRAYDPDNIARGGAWSSSTMTAPCGSSVALSARRMKNPNPKPGKRAKFWRAPIPRSVTVGQRKQ